ncbi:hypothetical protein D3C87_1235360 [compost metagenome]
MNGQVGSLVNPSHIYHRIFYIREVETHVVIEVLYLSFIAEAQFPAIVVNRSGILIGFV